MNVARLNFHAGTARTDSGIQSLIRRLDELTAWCEEITLALQKSPDRQERDRLAAELRFISEEMKRINAEHHAIANGLNLIRSPREG